MKKTLFSMIFSSLTATTLFAAPQAVVFDFGGVMTGEPNREAVVDFISKSLHFTPEEFDRVNQEKRACLKQGKTDEEFWLSYAKNKGISLPSTWAASFKSVMKKAIGINPEMYALVDQLKEQKIQVALLSNIDERLSKLMRDFGFYAPFTPCLLSCEIGIAKPDPKAYAFLLSELKLPAKEVVFVDDRPENIEAAKKMGIDAILFESESQLREALRARDALK
jgi:putative hydrolase of the HAD superfamily